MGSRQSSTGGFSTRRFPLLATLPPPRHGTTTAAVIQEVPILAARSPAPSISPPWPIGGNVRDHGQQSLPEKESDLAGLRVVLHVLWVIIWLVGLAVGNAAFSGLGHYIGLVIAPRPMTDSFATGFAAIWATIFWIVAICYILALFWGYRRITQMFWFNGFSESHRKRA